MTFLKDGKLFLKIFVLFVFINALITYINNALFMNSNRICVMQIWYVGYTCQHLFQPIECPRVHPNLRLLFLFHIWDLKQVMLSPKSSDINNHF